MAAQLSRRGRLRTRDGIWHELPEQVLDQEQISWPLGMPEKEPDGPTKILKSGDWYKRHEFVEGTAYIYLPADTPPEVTAEIRRKLSTPDLGEATDASM